jgi:3,4-dihydroxy 2-butanone 4-phosphate synthase
MPEPTVIVRMKEDKTDIAGQTLTGWPPHGYFCLPFHALILVLVFFRSLTMNQSLLSEFGDPIARVEAALAALRAGQGVLVADDEDRENEGDLIFAAETMTNEQMAMMIRECSGIVCLCLTDERVRQLELPMMVEANSSHYQTAFTVTIEAAQGVTTGVSAADRITTIRAAIADGARPSDLHRPGHVFPLRARTGGVLTRRGHTEATVDLMQLAGLKPYGVLCELTKEDGSMARLPDLVAFGRQHRMPVLTIEDLVQYRQLLSERSA